MPQTPREIVTRCLKFEYPERIPRDLWLLPWTSDRYPDTVAEINRRFPNDFVTSQYFYSPSPKVKGDPYKMGTYIDEWGCIFVNYQNGVIGEVKEPMIKEISDWQNVEPPYEQLPKNENEAKKEISKFVSEASFTLGVGEGVVLFTDGITEAENLTGEQYGLERLCAEVSRNWKFSPEQIKQAVIDDVRRHIGKQIVYDDLTMIVIKKR